MLGLTPNQHAAFQFISQYAADHGGVSPSYTEICGALSIRSKSVVSRLVDCLEERGRIRRVKNMPRSISIITPINELPSELRERLDRYCLKHGKDAAAIVAYAVADHLDNLELTHLRGEP